MYTKTWNFYVIKANCKLSDSTYMHNNNDMHFTSVLLVFVICWLLNIYRCLLVSASPLAAYYQHACQHFTLTLKLLLYHIPICTAYQYDLKMALFL